MNEGSQNNKKTLAIFMLLLLVFLVLINLLVAAELRTTIRQAQATHEQNDAALFSEFVTSLLVQKDFAKIVDLVSKWGNKNNDLVNIRLVAENNYVLAEYHSDNVVAVPSVVKNTIKIRGLQEYRLSLTYDRIKLISELNNITVNLVVVSTIIFIILSTILWQILLKTALLPLQREALRHKKTSDELLIAKGEADRANKAKSEFLANMSHEIRTPMNGILGMLNLVKETSLTKEQQEYVDAADTSAKTLMVIINDILDFSKIEAGKLEIENVDFDLHAVVENVGALFASAAFNKGLELAIDINENVPTYIQSDPTRLTQIISNLVGNAIKFTDQGEIVISVIIKAEYVNNKIKLYFEVKDTGIGIPPGAVKNIFSEFTQADTSTTRIYGGTGLGLSISKQIIELMGGEIGVSSTINEGSIFWFTIMVNKSNLESKINANPVDFSKKRILIVDDNTTNRKILNKQLDAWSIPHDSIDNGFAALEMIEQARRDGQAYNCILLDLMMPGMDGIEVAEKIKESLQPPDVIILSSSSTSEVSIALDDNVIKSYLLKPVRSSLLFNSISAVISGNNLRENIQEKNSLYDATKYSGKTALVVEDNIINQKVISGLLNKLGIKTDIANDGAEGVEKINSHKYDLVLMDCHMPVMNGFTATTIVREHESPKEHVTIIAMTANTMEGDREECLAAGMDDYLSKPIKPAVLLEILARWLEK